MTYVFLAFLLFTLYAAIVSLSASHFVAAIFFAVAAIGWGLAALCTLPETN